MGASDGPGKVLGMGRKKGQTFEGPTCGAGKKDGTRCKMPAGWGTDHPGVLQCKLHGGLTQVGLGHTGRPSLQLLVGFMVDIDPLEALLTCVRITAAEVNFYSAMIADLDPDDLLVRPLREQMGGKDAVVRDLKEVEQLNLWVQLRQKAIGELARYSKMALDAKVDERIVKFTQNLGNELGKFMRGVIDDLNLTEEQQLEAPAIVRKHLVLLQGGKRRMKDPFAEYGEESA